MQKFKLHWSALLAAILLLAAVFTSCQQNSQPEKKQVEQVIKKVVKAKNQANETTYKYKYNVWKGNYYHQPDIHTVYYLVYTDGSYDKVDVGKFTITNVGDTISQTVMVWQ